MLQAEPAETNMMEQNIEQTVSIFQKWQHQIIDWIMDPSTWEWLIIKSIRIALIILISRIAIKVLFRMIDRAMNKKGRGNLTLNPRRLLTIVKLLKNVTSLTLNFTMIMFILMEFNVNLAPLLAGAGVVTFAIGFGSQSLVKDVMTGFFIIFEDQFAVGDVIKVGQFQGTVEMIGLRSTRIHSWTGEIHIIPNGSITDVTNYSISNSLAVVDVVIAADEDVDAAVQRMEKILGALPEREPNVIRQPQVLGIQTMTRTETTIRIIAECKPFTQAQVSRLINLEVRKSQHQKEEEAAAIENYEGKGISTNGT